MTDSLHQITWDSARLGGKITIDFSRSYATNQAGTQVELTIPMQGENVHSETNIDHYVQTKMTFAHSTGISLANTHDYFDNDKALHVAVVDRSSEPSAILKKLVETGYISSEQGMGGFRVLAQAMDAGMQPHLDAIARSVHDLHGATADEMIDGIDNAVKTLVDAGTVSGAHTHQAQEANQLRG